MPGITICTDEIGSSVDDMNAASSSIGLKDCNSTRVVPGSKLSKSTTTTNTKTTISTTTTTTSTTATTNDPYASVTVSKTTTNSISRNIAKETTSSEYPSPTAAAPERQSKPTIFCTKSQKIPKTSSLITSKSNSKILNQQQPEQDVSFEQQQRTCALICPSCSSPDVIEVSLKLKSCQRCHEVVVDELNYKGQLNGSKKSLESTSNSSLGSQYNQHIAIITKKLKNIYKNRIHSATFDISRSSTSSKVNNKASSEIVQSSSQSEISVIAKTSLISTSNSTEIINSLTKSKTATKITTKATTSPTTNHPASIKINKEEDNQNAHDHDHHISCNCNAENNKLPLKTDSNKNLMNKDVLILRICDLDVKMKSKDNKNDLLLPATMAEAENAISNNYCNINENLDSKYNTSLQSQNQLSLSMQETSQTQSPKSPKSPRMLQDALSNMKISPKYKQNKPLGTQNYAKSMSKKIVVITDEYKKKSEKRTDVRIERRREMLKRLRQNNAISKSLDALAAGETEILPRRRRTPVKSNTFNESSFMYTSKSITNLEKADDDPELLDDDDRQVDCVNSVELIFISDEFLNKAVKHDLKIIENKDLSTSPEVPDNMAQLQQMVAIRSSGKKKLKKSQTIQTSPRSPATTPKPKSIGKQQSLSISPKNFSNKGTNAFPSSSSFGNIRSPTASSSSGVCGSGNKKLIIISEDFKRKSLENNIVIVDDITNSNLQSTTESLISKRRNLKHLKLTRQQSSIDDVGNHMTSHAFRSFEEPDDQCLESKEIKSPD